MASKYNVVFTGLKEGVTEDDFVDKFCEKFGIDEKKARKIAQSGSEVIIKKELEEAKAKKYQAALDACGMIPRLDVINEEPELGSGLSMEPMEEEPESGSGLSMEPMEEKSESGSGLSMEPMEETASAEEPAIESSSAKGSGPVCPKCGSDRIEGDECLACGIYLSKYLSAQSEKSTMDNANPVKHEYVEEPTDMMMGSNPYATPEADLMESTGEVSPEKVSAGSGIQWLGRSFWHFKQNPFAWIASIIVMLILFIILALIPFLGGLLTNILSPVVMAGFAMGAHEQDQGGDYRVSHVFAGFSQNTGQLVLVGVIYLLALVFIGVVIGGLMGFMMADSMAMMNPDNPASMMSSMPPSMMILFLVAFALIIVITMAYYYAPALVALDDMSALSAMKMSLTGCLKNWLALLIFGVLIIILFFVASIPVFLGLLVAIPMVQAANYVSYRDIFHQEY